MNTLTIIEFKTQLNIDGKPCFISLGQIQTNSKWFILIVVKGMVVGYVEKDGPDECIRFMIKESGKEKNEWMTKTIKEFNNLYEQSQNEQSRLVS